MTTLDSKIKKRNHLVRERSHEDKKTAAIKLKKDEVSYASSAPAAIVVPDQLGFGDRGWRSIKNKSEYLTPETPQKKKPRKQYNLTSTKASEVVARVERAEEPVGKELGKGNFASVWLVDTPDYGKVALKHFKAKTKKATCSLEHIKRRAKREFEMRKKVPEHPNLVKYLTYVDNADGVGLFLELCPDGNLEKFVRSPNPVPWVVRALKDIASGLEFLHQHDLVHFDIKPDNILLGRSTTDSYPVFKIGDFGIAVDINAMVTREEGYTGDPRYTAPEALAGNDDYSSSGKADVFSLGVVVTQLLTALEPTSAPKNFPEDDFWVAFYTCGQSDEATANFLVDLLKKMLEHEPSKRLSSSNVVQKLQSLPSPTVVPSAVRAPLYSSSVSISSSWSEDRSSESFLFRGPSSLPSQGGGLPVVAPRMTRTNTHVRLQSDSSSSDSCLSDEKGT